MINEQVRLLEDKIKRLQDSVEGLIAREACPPQVREVYSAKIIDARGNNFYGITFEHGAFDRDSPTPTAPTWQLHKATGYQTVAYSLTGTQSVGDHVIVFKSGGRYWITGGSAGIQFCKGGSSGDIIAGAVNNVVDIWELQGGAMVDASRTQSGVHFIWLHRDGAGVLNDISSDRMAVIHLIAGEWHVMHAQCEG